MKIEINSEPFEVIFIPETKLERDSLNTFLEFRYTSDKTTKVLKTKTEENNIIQKLSFKILDNKTE